VAGYDFRFVSAHDLRGPNFDAVEAVVEVSRAGRLVTILKPQKRHFWRNSRQ